jgi:glucokinase
VITKTREAGSAVLAVDIGGTNIRAAIVDTDGAVIRRERIATPGEAGTAALLEELYALCDRVVAAGSGASAATGGPASVSAVGVSFGGPVDFVSQRVVRSQHVGGWDGLEIGSLLGGRYGAAAVVDNDANAAAIGEHRHGAGRGAANMIYLTVSTGIGGGVIIGDRVVRGRKNLAGEIGHLVVVDRGRECVCGKRGCVEAYASGRSLAAIAAELIGREPESGRAVVAEAGSGPVDSAAVYRAAASGDPVAGALVAESLRMLALGIANAVTLLDVDRIVIGGGVAASGAPFFTPLRAMVEELAMFGESYPVDIVPAALGDDAGLVGAAVIAEEIACR